MELGRFLPGAHFVFAFFLELANGLARLTPLSFGWLLVIAVTLHIARKTLTLAKPLEAFEHLLNRFIPSRSYSYHCISYPGGKFQFYTCALKYRAARIL